MKNFIEFIEPLTSFEKIILFLVIFWLVYLVCDYVLRRNRSIKRERMLLDYLRLKNEKWDVLIAILKNDNNLDSQYVSDKIEIDLSNFDRRYKGLIYHDLKKIKKFNNINRSNYQIISNLLSRNRFAN